MKRLTVIILGLVGVLLVGSLAFGWCPFYPSYGTGYNGYVFPQAQNINLDGLRKQISEKQAELNVLFAQKNPDVQKIAKLQQELNDLYARLNTANLNTQGYAYPHMGPHPYYGCAWGW